MVDIPFPLSSAPGRSPGEGAGRLMNCFSEPLGPTATSPAVWRRVPGLKAFATVAANPACRGFLEVNGALFAVIGGNLYVVASDGTSVLVGAVAGAKKVTMARNNKVPTPDLVMVTENGAFVVTSTTIAVYPDADLPQPVDVTFQDGYFIFAIGDGRMFASDLNDTAVNPLTNSKAEAKPDGLLRVIAFNNQLLAFGPYSTEFWIDVPNPAPAFPYSRSAAIVRGLAGAFAIAGYQDGFGAAALIWVADHNRVVRLGAGYVPEDISPPDLDRLIEAVTDKSTLEAMVYVSEGAPRWVISSLTWTWEFNLNTQRWNERESATLTRWRATQGVWAFGKWLVGDTLTGKIFAIDCQTYKEDVNALRFRLESGAVSGFPNRTRVARADFDFATGVGLATGGTPETDPACGVSYADDGGATWSLPLLRPLGRMGKPSTRVTLTRQGTSGPRGRRWRLDVSDPVYVAVTKGTQSTELRYN